MKFTRQRDILRFVVLLSLPAFVFLWQEFVAVFLLHFCLKNILDLALCFIIGAILSLVYEPRINEKESFFRQKLEFLEPNLKQSSLFLEQNLSTLKDKNELLKQMQNVLDKSFSNFLGGGFQVKKKNLKSI